MLAGRSRSGMQDGGRLPVAGAEWPVLGSLAVSVTIAYGVLAYAFAVLLAPMQRDLGWSPTLITGAFSLALGVSAVSGVVVGRILDRTSPRIVMTAGAGLGALFVTAWSQVTRVWELYAVFAVLGLAMATVLYPPTFTVATKWFGDRRRTAVQLITVVGATASLIFSPLTSALSDGLGWRSALLVLAIVLACTAPLHFATLRRPPAAASPPSAGEVSASGALRSPRYWALATCFALSGFAWSAMTVHLVTWTVDRGHSPGFAALAAGLMGAAQLPGRLGLGVLESRTSARGVIMVVFAGAALPLAVLALEDGQLATVVCVVTFGASAGMQTILGATLPADLFGVGSYGTLYGVISGCVTGARAAAPVAAAGLVQLAGGYDALAWTLVAAVILAGSLGVRAMPPSSMRREHRGREA